MLAKHLRMQAPSPHSGEATKLQMAPRRGRLCSANGRKRAVGAGSTRYVQGGRAENAQHPVRGTESQMESATAAQERLHARQRELQDELAQVQRQLKQLETTVVASRWRHAPSGP